MDSAQVLNFLETLFVKYGTFITLFLGVIVYFIKRAYDYKSKKVEINHSIFQQNRIEAVNRFFVNYSAAKTMWHELPHHDAIECIMSAKELDKIVQPAIRDVRLSMLELRLYFEPKTYEYFEGIENGFDAIYNCVGDLRGDYSERENKIARGNKLSFLMSKTFKDNEKLITQVCDLIRKDYKGYL